MRIMAENDRFACTVLDRGPMDSEDFAAFAMSFSAAMREKMDEGETDLTDTFESVRRDGLQYWRFSFAMPTTRHFIVWRKEDGLLAEPAGVTSLWMPALQNQPSRPLVMNLHTLQKFRGNQVAGLLYDGVFHFIREHTGFCDVGVEIDPDNWRSLRVAEKSGFAIRDRDRNMPFPDLSCVYLYKDLRDDPALRLMPDALD